MLQPICNTIGQLNIYVPKDPKISTLVYLPKRNEKLSPHKYFSRMFRATLFIMATIKMSINTSINKQTVAWSYEGILFLNKVEQMPDVYIMGESHKYYVERKNPNTK